MSTPNLKLKRKLAEYFTVYNLDEFRTSCLNYKTEERCDNLVLPDKKGKEREIHSILTYQMENKRMGCINRDLNSVNNMVKIVKYYLKNGKRPYRFTRNCNAEEIPKGVNPKQKCKVSNDAKPETHKGKTQMSKKVQLHHLKLK
jgi:hypothetical protein